MQARPDATIAVSRGSGETADGVATQTYQITVTAQGTQSRQKQQPALLGKDGTSRD